MAPHSETVEEQQQQPEATGIPETNIGEAAEEEGNYRSHVQKGAPMPLSCGFKRGDKVFYVPDPRKKRSKSGPYEILGAREGPAGHPPIYKLKGLDQDVSEMYLAY